jgi:two-component system, NarL family, sensor histidine kinase DegS
MADLPTPPAEDPNVSRRELRLLKWLTALLVPGTIILIYELVRQEALEHLLPALPSQYGTLVVWGLVLLITYLFSTFVFRVVDRLQSQALARGRDVATMRAVLEERARLSRELHDGFAQLVAFLLVRIDTVTDLVAVGRRPEALAELDRMRSSTDDLYQDVREAITELRTELAQRGLPATLREYAEEYEERHGVTVSLHGEDATSALSSVAAYQLLRIVQEGLANVRKHAGAHRAWLEFDTRGDRQLHVVIGDDGLGFDPLATERKPRSFGLTSMRERAEGLGGQLAIESQRGRGTRILVELPIESTADANSRAALATAAR